jgi:hypothetical protein
MISQILNSSKFKISFSSKPEVRLPFSSLSPEAQEAILDSCGDSQALANVLERNAFEIQGEETGYHNAGGRTTVENVRQARRNLFR